MFDDFDKTVLNDILGGKGVLDDASGDEQHIFSHISVQQIDARVFLFRDQAECIFNFVVYFTVHRRLNPCLNLYYYSIKGGAK